MGSTIYDMADELYEMSDQYIEEMEVAGLLIGEKAERLFAENITQGDFVPLSESRIRHRGSSEPILIDTGQGLESVANSAQAPITEETAVVVNFEAENYMKYHNEGEGNNPKRAFAEDSEELDQIIGDIIEERLEILNAE